MKVLVIIPYFSSVYGGNTRVVKDLYQCLGKLNVEIDIITTIADGDGKLEVPIDTWIEHDGYRVRYFKCSHRYDLVLSFSLLTWLSANVQAYDLVHTHNRFSPLIAFCELICQRQQIPYISTPHGMLEPWAMSYKAWKKRLYFPVLERLTLNKSAALHVLTSNEEINIKNLGIQTPTEVIANGIHRYNFEPMPCPNIFLNKFSSLKEKMVILFLGRIDPKKGLDILAPAFAKVQTEFPKTHLVIAGPENPGYLDTAKDFFAKAGCSNAVTFTGMLEGELKYSALASASIYVAPYYSEGFSMSVLEGMAAGLPAVITTGCNFTDAEEAGVAKVVEIEAPALAKGLLYLLQNPLTATAMGQQAQEFIFEHYTWDVASHKLKELYTKILSVTSLEKRNVLSSTNRTEKEEQE
jgi:glycosyltransferase involved in cell wall biosynthesis